MTHPRPQSKRGRSWARRPSAPAHADTPDPVAHPDNRWSVDDYGWLYDNGEPVGARLGEGQHVVLAALNGPSTDLRAENEAIDKERSPDGAEMTWTQAMRRIGELRAELDRARPVLNAALEVEDYPYDTPSHEDADAELRAAVRAYREQTDTPAPDDSWPDPHDLIVELREAVGLFAGAMPIPPKVAWDEAVAVAKRAVQERDEFEAASTTPALPDAEIEALQGRSDTEETP